MAADVIHAPTIPAVEPSQRRRFTVTGVVQGVGFRPFVYRLASDLGLTGFVGNDSATVFIEVQGTPTAVGEFADRLVIQAPPLAVINNVSWVELTAQHKRHSGFRIAASRAAADAPTPIPADIAVCDDCLAELSDPADRRYRHPFVTCTNCGPRFTIIRALPYDRPATTMADFDMCDRCVSRVPQPCRSAIPRPTHRLPRLRSVVVVRRQRRSHHRRRRGTNGHPACPRRRQHPRHQRHRWLSPRLRAG